MRPVTTEQARAIEELRDTARHCSFHGTQQVEASSPVAAREWFDAAAAAARAAYELERRDRAISGGMET